jgi:hypothetical protein
MPRLSHLIFKRQPHDALPKSAAFVQADTDDGGLCNCCLYEIAERNPFDWLPRFVKLAVEGRRASSHAREVRLRSSDSIHSEEGGNLDGRGP